MYLRPNGQQIINSRSSDQLCFPIRLKKKFCPQNGQENNELDNLYKHNFLNTNNFFNFNFKKNLNGKGFRFTILLCFPAFCLFVSIKVFCTGKF